MRQALIVAAVGLALVAQQLAHDPARALTGWKLFGAAAALIVLTAWGRRSEETDDPGADVAAARELQERQQAPRLRGGGDGVSRTPTRLVWAALAILCVATTTALSTLNRAPVMALLLWFSGFGFASAALWRSQLSLPRRRISAWTRRELAALAGILLVAGVARTAWLNSVPDYFFGDEPRVGVYLLRTFTHAIPDFFTMGWNTWPVLGLSLQGIFAPLLGLKTFALRLSSAMMGTLAVLFTYLLARQLFSTRMAVLSALLFALCRTAIDFSRLGICHAQVMGFETLAFFCWWRAVNTGKGGSYLWAGIGLGLCLFTYNAGQLVPPLWLGWVVLCLIAAPRTATAHWRGALVTLAGFALAAFPFLFYVTDHFSFGRTWFEYTFMARDRQVTNQVLSAWSASGFDAAFAIIREQALRTWLGFSVLPAGAYALGYRGSGMLDHVTAPLFVLGLAHSLSRVFHARCAFLVYWWLVTGIAGSVLTAGPPATVRLVGVLPALAILAAVPLAALIRAAGSTRWRAMTSAAAVGILVSGAAWDNWQTYFVAFPRDTFDPTSELAHAVRRMPRNATVLLAGSEHFLHFNQELFVFEFPDRHLDDVIEPAHLLPIHFATEGPVVVVFGPTQLTLARYAQTLYPDAEVSEARRTPDEQPLFRAMLVTREQVARNWGLALAAYGADDTLLSTSVANPFSPIPNLPGDTKRLAWRGSVYWPTDAPATLTARGAGPFTVQVGPHAVASAADTHLITLSLQLARGWQPFLIEQRGAAPQPLAISITSDTVTHNLAAPDVRPDATGEGLLGVYRNDREVLLRTIDPQVNSYTVEALFRPIYQSMPDLPLQMPFTAAWEGFVWIERPGTYAIEATGSGAYVVRLDGTTLFEEVNIIPEEPRTATGSRSLTAGAHPLSVTWDSTRAAHTTRRLFQLYWTPPGGARELIPPSAFRVSTSP